MPAWREVWAQALYGDSGFYRRHQPSAHFRTSPMVSDQFAAALARLARGAGLDTVHDVGAGGAELLEALHRTDPALRLSGVDIRPRPTGLPESIDWVTDLPRTLSGLVVANEWLDTVPAPVVEVDPDGIGRLVMVDDGMESLGSPIAEADPAAAAWLDEWWPLSIPGQRAVVGLPRDLAAGDLARRLESGIVLLIDYGHTREDRPFLGGTRCYRDGRQITVTFDGSADVTAEVAVDSVATAIGGRRITQTAALSRLGLSLPPGGDLGDLARAAEVRELLDPMGLGAFHWMMAWTSGVGPLG